jgi:hypothetical protein
MQARQGAHTLLVEKIGLKILDRKARPVFGANYYKKALFYSNLCLCIL